MKIANVTRLICAAVAFLGTASLASAADWSRFCGPNLDLTSPETGLMKAWPAGGPKELWSVSVGKGFGGVAIKDGEVYILDREATKADILRCLDLKTGREQWRFRYPAAGKVSFPGSRSHPTVDDRHVFIVSPFGELRCISRSTRKPRWTRNILKEFGGKRPNWAYTQAPALYENLVVVAPASERAGMVAYTQDTGKLVWKSKPFGGKIGYSSPMLARIGGVDQFLTSTTSQIVGVDAKSGSVLWQSNDWDCRIPIATPTHVGDGLVFMSGGYDAGTVMLRVRKSGSRFVAKTLWKTTESNCQIHQPIRIGDYLYLNGNDKAKKHGFQCLGLDGSIKWQTGTDPGFDWGGLLYADGMIYTVDGNTGDLVMIKPDPRAYREVARANLLSGKQQWGTIAITDGKILLRDQTHLKCVDVRGR